MKKLTLLFAIAWLTQGWASAADKLPPIPETADWRLVDIKAQAHTLSGDVQDDQSIAIGRLVYRGGVKLTSNDPGFGGFSGLSVSPDGRGLLAISDRGQWLAGSILYSSDGQLTGLLNGRMAALTDKDGGILSGALADAEGLVLSADTMLVSFEREPRIDAYKIHADGLLHLEDRPLDLSGIEALHSNSSLESVAHLSDGRLITIAEDRIDEDDPSVTGWIVESDGLSNFYYQPAKDFQVADAHAGPDNMIYFLERTYSPFKGVRIRITTTSTDNIAQGRTVTGEEIFKLGTLQGADNFEGLAVRRDILGRTFIYLISDDNFSARQKNLLLMFELTEASQ